MFISISNMTSLPRRWAGEVSVCHMGAVAVFRPLPILRGLVGGMFESEANVPEDNTPHKHLRETERRSLEDSANGHDGGANQDGLLPPQSLPNREGDDGAEEAANVVDGGDGGQDRSPRRALQIM